ncbi:trichoplein keratin filament-binding protein isoform X1 [Cyclopterus lumpus]|uniref:Trichoplein keratin filament-binding protein n=1 Tax=Cyclopterus lumpus TaxID=8103 RepID=A0A8C2X0Y5_CYCLU|nr:trichoplein keratin filament-binding protein isoform X1 [Cyclopterus lumpus]XP_034397535.1 trichoplein keratin filament-binding protein isoform X1 [Cyclopterus lumpus]
MALPLSAHVPNRSRVLAGQLARQREQEARCRQQWELHAQYFREQGVRSQRQAAWSSSQSYQQSMSAYHKQRLEEEKKASLEQRRNRLRAMLQEEQDGLEAELREVVPDRSTLESQLVQKNAELRTAREERRKKLAQELLREHWKKNTTELREVESALHKDHVVSQWQEQISEKKQQEVAEQDKKRRFENEYERTRKEALGRLKQAEEKKNVEELKRAEELRKQMEELKLREEEATRLKKEQEALLVKQWELEKMEEERRKVEERRKKTEMGHFLIRQYRAQLKRRAQQVQEELEADRKILAALLEGQQVDRRMETARRERAIADAAWMKRVIEEQLQLEQEREAEFEILHREEAQHVWEKREAQWEKERKARERLMQEVLLGRQQQLELTMQKNREAQEESLRRREQLIQELELERETRRQEEQQEEGLRTARMQEINAQVEQQRQEKWEEQCRKEQEEEEDREALQIQEEELRLEMQRMAKKGYQEKIHSRPRSAWT